MGKKSEKSKQKGNQPTRDIFSITHLNIVFTLVFVGLVLYFTAIYNVFLLRKLDELSLFLNTRLYLSDHLKEPAGMLSYLGAFVTQFFYYPWIGSLIFLGFLMLIQFLTYKIFSFSRNQFILSFIPSATLLWVVTQVDYVIYEFVANGFVYMGVFGVLSVYGSIALYKRVGNKVLKYLMAATFVGVSYPFLGFYALLAAVLMLVFEATSFFNDHKKEQLIAMGILLLTLIVVPQIYFQKVYQISIGSLYTAGLPEFKWEGSELLFWLPVALMVISMIVFSLKSLFKNKTLKKPIILALNAACGVILFALIYGFSNKDENFHTELAMEHALFENQWSEVLKLERAMKGEPTELITLETRLALQKMQKAGDLMFTRKEGKMAPQSKRELSLWSYAAQPVFFHYGMPNDCYRWCMEDLSRFGPKVQYLRYMTKCALLNNELVLADKYTSILSHTLFHKRWAKKYQNFIDQPELAEADPELKQNRALNSYSERFVTDYGRLNDYIISRLTSIKGGQLELLELSMQSFLLLKDADHFWPFFFLYAQNHNKIPVHYQEAALFFSQKNKQIDLSSIQFDDAIVNKFYQAHNNIPQQNVEEYFKKNYGDTYWYYLYYGKL